YLLLGSPRPYAIDAERMGRELDRPAVRDDLRWIDVRSAAGILGDLVAGTEDLAGFVAGARVQTDDGLHLEFRAPLGFYGRRRLPPLDVLPVVHQKSLESIVRGRPVDWSEARTLLRESIKAILDQRDPIDRIRLLKRALERFPEERQARLLLDSESEGCVKEADLALARGHRERFEQLIEAVPVGSRWYPAARFRRIGMLRKTGAPPSDFGSEYRKILEAAPGLESAVEPYVQVLLALGAKEEAERVAREAQERHPKSARLCLARARALLGLGRRDEASSECDRAVELDPSETTRRERSALLERTDPPRNPR
ncbi:MAG TPA: tetratricopeptide repeat protein, partial [Planctomycetota bacterium]|nr:tetratricopeptide repeat protein [Planctomycetota bacterium]